MCSGGVPAVFVPLPGMTAETSTIPADREADARTRTADPFITSEVLYQLSYVGVAWFKRLRV